ncbi:MAG: PKD domain-containing protein, partial [Acidobacteriota bacterium]|nr:PKD domain-containing protein [Acidobacteriota bacterium]
VCSGNGFSLSPSITFDWTPSSGAAAYSVIRDGATIASDLTQTSFSDTAVTAGQTYTYSVVARDQNGATQPSANSLTLTAPYCQPPDPPALAASSICLSARPAVQLSWNSVARAENYDLYKNGIRIQSSLPPSTTSYIDTNVTAGQTVSYFVRPTNVGTIGQQNDPTTPSDSNTVTLTVSNPCPPPPPAPAVSANATCATSGPAPTAKVTITWTASPGATSYALYRNDSAVVTSTTATSYEDFVAAGNSYTYKVYASGEGGQGAFGSAIVNVAANICAQPPGAITLQASSVCNSSNVAVVRLSWSSSTNATLYTIYRDNTAIATRDSSGTFEDAVAVGSTHTYFVRASNNDGQTDSSPVTITLTDPCPRPPGAFTSSVSVFCSNNAAAVRVTWTASSGASSYSVIRNNVTIATGLTGTSYDDTNVTVGATYSYVVRAVNNSGTADTASSGVTVVDPCPRPPGPLTLSGGSYCSGTAAAVHLSWSPAAGALSYSIVRNDTVIATNVSGTTYEDTNVSAGTSYTYIVRALNANGSTDSNPLSVTPASCNVPAPRADLEVSNVTLSQTTVGAGQTVDVTYTIANNGNAAAGETQTRIRIGSGASPQSSDVLLFSVATPPLAAGASRTETRTVTISGVGGGTYSIYVSVNDDRVVDETTFSNNIGRGGPLNVAQPQCQVSCLVSAPAKATVGQNVTFSLLSTPSCPATVSWLLGDDMVGGGATTSTQYAKPGTYTWTVNVTTESGASCSNAGQIEVTAKSSPATSRRRSVRH